MATPNPAQEIAEEIRALQTRITDLQSHVQLTDSRAAVEQFQANINGMPQRIANLRARGYVFEKDLEGQVQAFAGSWALLYPNVQAQINAQSSALVNALRPIEMQMPQLAALAGNPGAARGLLASLQSAVGQVEGKVTAATNLVEGMYSQFNNQVSPVERHLDDIDYMLQQLAEASFQLLPTEAGIAAVKAVWCKAGREQKGDPSGVLYLTDQRLIFEQKEEIATKKVLFVVTDKQKVQGLQLEVPVAQVEKVDISKQGLMKNEDFIEVHFASGAPVLAANFHIWKENAAWQALINRAKTKDFDQGRAVQVDQAAVERVKSAPTQCPACGGNITTVVLRGMDSIKCEYCGMVIRLTDGPATNAVVPGTKELNWGTVSPVMVRLGAQVSAVSAYGKVTADILDPAAFQQKFSSDDDFQAHLKSVLVAAFSDIVGQMYGGITSPDALGTHAVEIAGKLQDGAAAQLSGVGVKLSHVTVDGLKVNPTNG